MINNPSLSQSYRQRTSSSPRSSVNILSPAQIKAYLDQYVIGQEEAKKTLSVAVYNHYKRIAHFTGRRPAEEDMHLDKSNVLLLGDTGSGKTLLVKTVARLLNVPYHIQDCTKITASGYVGSDVEDCIVGLLKNCDYNIQKAQLGIIMLDEIDKNASKSSGVSVVRDVSGECVQQSLLKIIEGDVVGVPPMGGRKHPEQPLLYVDTTNILFIASGAFVGLESIISKRLGEGKSKIGFGTCHQDASETSGKRSVLSNVTPQDLRDFGMIPEFVGRMPIITTVSGLTRSDLVRILTEPKDSLTSQYIHLLSMDGVDLSFSAEALDMVAEIACRMGTGARGLRNILETTLRDVMFEAPSLKRGRTKPKVVVTVDMVRDKAWNKFIGMAV